MKFFDTHTHVDSEGFKGEKDDVIRRALENSTWMINVGTHRKTSQEAVDTASKYEQGVFAAVGLHPSHTFEQVFEKDGVEVRIPAEEFDEAVYEKMLTAKVVGVGECGLDYFRLPETGKEAVIAKQKEEFIKHLNFAKKHSLPIIIHCREAYADVLEILKSEYKDGPGVIHSFTDTWDTAKQFLDLGFYVAFNGILTFDKTGKLAEVVEKAPFDRILIETDAPFLTPPPFRGKRNEPLYVKYVAQRIADIKKLPIEQVAEQTFKNACRLFKIQV